MGRSETLRDGAGAAAFLVVYAYLVRNVEIGKLYAFGDLPPYYGTRAIGKFLSTWHYAGLGYSYQYNVVPAYLGVVTAVGGAIAQNLFYLLLIPAGYLAFVVFVGRFVDATPARHLAAGVYAINPLTIGEFANGDVVSLIGFAGLPLVLHYLYAVVERNSWTSALKAGMAFGATTVVPWLGFWMVAPFATILLVRARSSPARLAKLGAAGLAGVTLALPGVYNMIQRVVGLESSFGRELLLDSLRWNYAEATPLALLRLSGNHGDRAMEQLGYNADPVLGVAGLIVPGVALLAVSNERVRPYVYVVAGTVTFAYATHLGATYPLFEAFPPLLSLRNPSKLMYPLLVGLSVLFGVGLESILAAGPTGGVGNRLGGLGTGRRAGANRSGGRIGPIGSRRLPDVRRLAARSGYDRRSVLIVCLVVLMLFTYAVPAAGSFGVEEVRGEDYYIPEEEREIAERLDGRVLWVPYTYTTQLRLRHDYPDHVGVKSGGVYHGIQSHEHVTDLFRTFAERPDESRPSLANLGVTYVVVDSSPPGPGPRMGQGPPRVVQRWGAPWLAGAPARFDRMLAESPGYAEAFTTDRYTVYRVEGATARPRYEQFEGLHAVSYPREPSVQSVGENRLANPAFDDGTEQWWTPPEMEREVVSTGGENALLLEPEDPAAARAIAQEVDVRERYPYRVNVDADGAGSVHLFWYDGEKSADDLVEHETYPVGEMPTVVRAKGDVLSFRVKPNASRFRLREASVVRTTYPAQTGFSANVEDVPGVVVDAHGEPPAGAASVAVNTGGDEGDRAAVRVVDAETVVDGELVFDPEYRQGVAVLPPAGERPPEVPEDASIVTRDTPSGRAIDYWVVGEFDDTPVTVLRTSYDEDWSGPPGSRHFEAYGWANGFTDASPAEIRWTGGDGRRLLVIQAWLALWAAAFGLLLIGRTWPLHPRGLADLERLRRSSATRRPRNVLSRDD